MDGCSSLRLESIKIHETSATHIKATQILSAKSEPESKDDGSEAGPVEPLSRGDSCEETEENVGAEENEDRDVVDTECDSDGYDSGVDNASDFDSDVEERQVESLISKYS